MLAQVVLGYKSFLAHYMVEWTNIIMLRTGHRNATGVRAYKRTTSTLKKKTSSVLNDCTNTVVEESLPKKAKLEEAKS